MSYECTKRCSDFTTSFGLPKNIKMLPINKFNKKNYTIDRKNLQWMSWYRYFYIEKGSCDLCSDRKTIWQFICPSYHPYISKPTVENMLISLHQQNVARLSWHRSNFICEIFDVGIFFIYISLQFPMEHFLNN